MAYPATQPQTSAATPHGERSGSAPLATAGAADGNREDADLVGRMADGDSHALADIYDRYAAAMLGVAIQILRCRDEAEEVLQEVMVQAWRQAARYDPRRSSVKTWLSLMTRCRSIDRRRVNATRNRTAQNVRLSGTLRSKVEAEGAHRVFLHQLRTRLRRELERIPGAQRQVVELTYFAGLTQLEIAERMQIPLGTVKTRHLLAMKKLRRALRRDLAPQG